MKIAVTALAVLAITTLLNGWLCQRLRNQMTVAQIVMVTIFSATQGLMFVAELGEPPAPKRKLTGKIPRYQQAQIDAGTLKIN